MSSCVLADMKGYEPDRLIHVDRRPSASDLGQPSPLAKESTADGPQAHTGGRRDIAGLHDKGQPNAEIAQTLGITEAAVRYHLRRQGMPDGRQSKPRKADALAPAIAHRVQTHDPEVNGVDPNRPVNVQSLYDWLCQEHAYDGLYKSALRFVRAHYPQPRLRPFRRVETPPGAQARLIGASSLAWTSATDHKGCTPLSWCCPIRARRS